MSGSNTTDSALQEKCERFRRLVAANMRRRRAALGLTQEQLAEKVDLSVETIGKLETQKQWFSIESLVLITEALGMTPCQLFLDTEHDSLVPVAEILGLAHKYSPSAEDTGAAAPVRYHTRNARRS